MKLKLALFIAILLPAANVIAESKSILCEWKSDAESIIRLAEYAACPKETGLVRQYQKYTFDLDNAGIEGSAEVEIYVCGYGGTASTYQATLSATPNFLSFEYCPKTCELVGHPIKDVISRKTLEMQDFSDAPVCRIVEVDISENKI